MRHQILLGVLFFGLMVAPACAAKKPNIVFILVDDMGYMDVGFTGSAYYQTPHIDRLAQQGVVLTDAYAMPTCAPSRACLVTGQYPSRHRIYTVDFYAGTPAAMRKVKGIRSKRTLDTKAVTFAEQLKAAGYRTAQIGKWHLGDQPATLPTGQGFDFNFAGGSTGAPRSFFRPYKNVPHAGSGPEGEYLTDRLTDEACAFIERSKDGPFFLYLPFYSVHVPVHATADRVRRYENVAPMGGQDMPEYGAMVTAVDDSVGRIVAKLEALGLDDNTLIVFTSDNGGQITVTDNAPLRGQKGDLHEGGVRVPTFVRWPGRIEPGTTNPTPVAIVDWMPTLLEAAGAEAPGDLVIDGESLVPLLTNNTPLKRDAIYFHMPGYNGNGRTNALVWQPPAGAIRMGRWKLIENFEDGSLELYDLHADLGERHNLAGAEPRRAQQLLAKLKAWQKDVDAPIPTEANPKYNPDSRKWLKNEGQRQPLSTAHWKIRVQPRVNP